MTKALNDLGTILDERSAAQTSSIEAAMSGSNTDGSSAGTGVYKKPRPAEREIEHVVSIMEMVREYNNRSAERVRE
jgi:hypothetical protein